MSGSHKKMLRKEQNMSAMTEKQKQASKEAKKLKAYTLTFAVVMIVVVAILVGIVVRTPIAGLISRSTNAVMIGEHKLSTAELSYYYVDTINNHYEQYSSYGDYAQMYAKWIEGIDFSKPVGEQIQDKETGKTWADYYVEEAINSAKKIFALYDLAVAENFKLSEDSQKYMDSFEEYIEAYSSMYGYSSANGYLRSMYGSGANLKTYKEYSRISMIASEYYSAHEESLEYTIDDYREFDNEKYNEYSSYVYDMYTISVDSYLKGGTVTKDEEGDEITTYSDEEKKAAAEAAKKDAEGLAIADNNTLEKLNAAIKALEVNKDKTDAAATTSSSILYSKLTNKDIQKWISDTSRKPGDITSIEISTTSTDEDGNEVKDVTGYYIVRFDHRNDNLMKLRNVRHILVAFEGGTKDKTTGETVYSEDEKAAAKTAAHDLLDLWKESIEGKNQEEAEKLFADIANKESDDGDGTTGGLYEDVYPGQMVGAFENWCFDDERAVGDTGIIETEYGYHVMYYVSTDEMTYRDYMVDADMTAADMEEWIESITKPITVAKNNLNGINRQYAIAAS